MLAQLRKGAGTWVARLLLGLLIMSFGVWGVSDFIQGTQDRDVAKVGSTAISAQEFDQQYRRELNLWQQRLGAPIDNERARQLGLPEATLQTMVQRTLIDQEVDRLGLQIGNDTLAREIRNNPSFRNAQGQFDRFIFEQLLAQNGWNERIFLSLLRRDSLREHLLGAIEAGAAQSPAILTDTLLSYRQEKRTMDVLAITPQMIGPIPEPDQATLEAFHKENAARFTTPELRRFAYVLVSPEILSTQVTVSDDELQEEYQARRAEFESPERRQVEQVVYPTEEEAKAAHDRMAKGEDFAAVAKATRNLDAKDLTLGLVTKTQLPGAVAESAFNSEKGKISTPIQSPFGWHVLRVVDIQPGKTKTLNDVKDDLKHAVALRKAGDLTFKTANLLEDEIAGGATFEQAAAKLSLKVEMVAGIDAQGRDARGQPIKLPALPNFLSAVFSATPGGESRLIEAADGQAFILRIDEVIPASLKPLTDVKRDVLAAWRLQAIDERTAQKGQDIANRLKEGGNFSTMAKSLGAEIKTSRPFTRTGEGAEPNTNTRLIAAAFNAKQGEAVTASAGPGQGFFVAQVKEIIPSSTTPDPVARERLARQLAAGIAEDLNQQYRSALEATYGVRINRQLLETLF